MCVVIGVETPLLFPTFFSARFSVAVARLRMTKPSFVLLSTPAGIMGKMYSSARFPGQPYLRKISCATGTKTIGYDAFPVLIMV